MRERHNWSGTKHPPACTCAECTARRNAPPQVRKKNKPKSQRGKPKKSAIEEALDIFSAFEQNPPQSNDTPQAPKT